MKSLLARGLIYVALALTSLTALAQNTVTLTPTITAGAGSVTTDVTWSTSPPIPTGTPCTAGGDGAGWNGAKADHGTITGLTFTANTHLTLSCVFSGDSIATISWTNPTKNTDGTNYTNPKLVRLKSALGFVPSKATLCTAAGVTCTDVLQTPTAATVKTITGITQVGVFNVLATAINQTNDESDASNVAMKTFTGNVTVNQGVDITIRSIPNGPTTLGVN